MKFNGFSLSRFGRHLICAVTLSMALVGCASVNEMALDQEDIGVDVTKDSLVLLTLSASQQGSALRELNIDALYMKHAGDAGAGSILFEPDAEGTVDKDGHITYQMRMSLPPGSYQIVWAHGFVGFLPVMASAWVPLLETFTVPPHSVVYLGHMDIELRPGKTGDVRAGPRWPLAQQVMGVANGTYDITITDRPAQDLPLLISEFPALKGQPIVHETLAPWDRAAARVWAAKYTPF